MTALAFLVSCQQGEPAQRQPVFERLPGVYQFTEGPAWSKEGHLFFTDIPANRIYRWDGRSMSVFREPSMGANGLAFGEDGTLFACEHGSRSVTETPPAGQRRKLVATYEDKALNSPNDVAIRPSSGEIVFTDPTYGLGLAQSETGGRGVYLHNPKTGSTKRLLLMQSQPNGVAFSSDGEWLFLADSGTGKLSKHAFKPEGLGQPAWSVDAPSADGVRVAKDGRVWAACADGVRIYRPDGGLERTLSVPEQPSNLCFDKAESQVVVTARTGVYRARLPLTGGPSR